MGDPTTHHGSCHCGKVRYQVAVDLEQPVFSCNCSMCGRTGTLLSFVTEDQFTLESGASDLSDYQFHKEVIHHLFCSTCGVKSFARGRKPDGTQMVAVNVRCLEGVDLDALDIKKVDGKSL